MGVRQVLAPLKKKKFGWFEGYRGLRLTAFFFFSFFSARCFPTHASRDRCGAPPQWIPSPRSTAERPLCLAR